MVHIFALCKLNSRRWTRRGLTEEKMLINLPRVTCRLPKNAAFRRTYAKSYKDTINLPKSSFPKFIKKAQLSNHDRDILEVSEWCSYSFILLFMVCLLHRNTSNRCTFGNGTICREMNLYYTMDHRMPTAMFTWAMQSINCSKILSFAITLPIERESIIVRDGIAMDCRLNWKRKR